MSENPRIFDLQTAREAVQLDTQGVIGKFLTGRFSVEDDLGDDARWNKGKSEMFAVGWRFVGEHTGRINGFGHTSIEPTHNKISVAGLTVVENTLAGQSISGGLEDLLRGGTIIFQRYIDWLAVFAQLGVLHLGRPMSISDIRFAPADRGKTRLEGYNDQQ